MGEQKAFDLGAAAGFFLAIAGFSGNWLISSHPDASPLRHALVIAQGLICLGIALFLFRARRPRISSSPAV
jgi:hypothetical protein